MEASKQLPFFDTNTEAKKRQYVKARVINLKKQATKDSIRYPVVVNDTIKENQLKHSNKFSVSQHQNRS